MKRGINFTLLVASFLLISFTLLTVSFVSAEITVNGLGNFSSISDAIVNASNGNVIEISNGTYFENITVDKKVTLQGESNTATIIDGSIVISSDNVKIKGFKITNAGGNIGVYSNGVSHIEISNNSFNKIGTVLPSGSAQAINIHASDSSISDIKIYNNNISEIGNLALLHAGSSGSSAKGIYFGDSNGAGAINLARIENNSISLIQASTSPWISGGGGGAGAYGILINHVTSGVKIYGNQIFDLEALWAHGIGLEGNTPNAEVKNNLIENLIDHKVGADAVAIHVEDNPSAGSVVASYNDFKEVSIGVDRVSSNGIVEAQHNYWGACDGPGLVGPGSGSTVSASVDFEGWIGACVESKSVTPICSIASSNLTLLTNITSELCIGNVTFGVVINGTEMNYTGTPVNANGSNYEFVLDKSLLEGGFLDWNVYADDCYGHLNYTSSESTYVNSDTTVSVVPSNPDGSNGWYVTEPVFTLTNPDATGTNKTIYRWDFGPEYNYSSPFGLENITNFPPISAGVLELMYRSQICSEEFQSFDFKADLVAPQFIELKPIDDANLTNGNVNVRVYIDEIFQSNSGVNLSTINLKVDDATVSPIVSQNGLDAAVNFSAVNLSNGKHNVSISAKDNAGNFNETLWEFNISAKPLFDITLNLPDENTYDNRRVQINITSDSKVDKLSYIDFSDSRPREKIICRRDCENYGNDKERFVTFSDGLRNLTFIGYSETEMSNESIAFIVDSKKPKVKKTEPTRGLTEGNFYVEFDEENPVSLFLNYGNNATGFRNEELNLSECVLGRRNYGCNVNVNLSDYNGQVLFYSFNITDIVGNSDTSRENDLEVDTVEPVIDNFFYSVDGRRVEFYFNVTEANFDRIIYTDSSDSNLREKTICSRLKGGICDKKVYFRTGEHNLSLMIKDGAGNFIDGSANFFIN